MHGPTCAFWANLTPFSRQLWVGQPPPPLTTEGTDPERIAKEAAGDPVRQAFAQMEALGALPP